MEDINEIEGEIKADKGALKDFKEVAKKATDAVKHSEVELKKDESALKNAKKKEKKPAMK